MCIRDRLNLDELERQNSKLTDKIKYLEEVFEKFSEKDILSEGILNITPETNNSDTLTPLNKNFVTLDQLQEHYRVFINRIQQQLSTLGGGGETQLQYLDDIVGIATNLSDYNGKFLKVDTSQPAGKNFVFATTAGGGYVLPTAAAGTLGGIKIGSGLSIDGDGVVTASGGGGSTGVGGTWAIDDVGISTTKKVGIGTTAKDGYSLYVQGDARITGILTVGEASITIDPSAKKLTGLDEIQIGSGTTAITIKKSESTGNIEFADKEGNEAPVGIGTTVSINTTGIITAANFSGIWSGTAIADGYIASAATWNAKQDALTNVENTALSTWAGTSNITTVGTLSSLSVNGDVSIGGTLTYEDVTNIESVGLITAKSGVVVVGGGVSVADGGLNVTSGISTVGFLTATDVWVSGAVTATTFNGSASGLTNVPGGQISGAIAAVSGANLTILNASNLASGTVAIARLGSSGTADSSTFLRGDNTWATPSGSGGGISNVIDDTNPGLGGDLDANNKNIKDVGIITATTLNVNGDITMSSTDAGATANPILVLDRNSASPANNDVLGDVLFKGRNDADEVVTYGSFMTKIATNTDGAEDGRLIFKTMKAGALSTVLDIKSSQLKINNVSEVFFADPVSALKFEGATGNANELTLAITDPTGDVTVTIPSVDGTIITTGNSGDITSVGIIGIGTWQGTAIADDYISSAGTWNGKQAALTFGIADTNAVKIDSSDVVDDEYARFTANGIEGRTSAELKSDLSLNNVENTALSTWGGSSNITTVGTLGSLSVTGDVSIGGTLTYEDVTNIESVGLITAKSGIHVDSGYGINVASGIVTATTFDASSYHSDSNSSRDKYRLWDNSNFTIGMKNNMSFGGLNSYGIIHQVTNHDDRGWVFLDTSHTDAQGAMSLNTIGELVVAKSIRAGGGESDTLAPRKPLDIVGDAIISGDVGIGTDNPDGQLNVYRDDAQIGHQIQISQDGTGDATLGFELVGTRAWSMGIDNSDGDKFKIASGSAVDGAGDSNPRLTIATDGNIGIGTDNPTGAAALTNNEAVLAVGVATANTLYGKLNNLTYPTANGTDGHVLTSDGAGVVQWEAAPGSGGGEANQNAFSNVAVSGQTTVEADSATDTLTLVAGTNVTITTDDSADSVTIAASGGGGGSGLWESNATGINTSTNVGIGTTTASDATLTVDVGTASTALVVQGSEGQLFSVTNSLSSGSIFSVNDISGIPSIDVDADGTIQLAPYSTTEYIGLGITNPTSKLHVVGTVKATDFDATSDIRLKTNIQPIGDPLAKVIQIEGVSFNWKENNIPALGVIADQLEDILPELVRGDDPKTVNYNGLIGLLIEAVKEQQTQIDNLKERISKLE